MHIQLIYTSYLKIISENDTSSLRLVPCAWKPYTMSRMLQNNRIRYIIINTCHFLRHNVSSFVEEIMKIYSISGCNFLGVIKIHVYKLYLLSNILMHQFHVAYKRAGFRNQYSTPVTNKNSGAPLTEVK
jgi:hypothetical protein